MRTIIMLGSIVVAKAINPSLIADYSGLMTRLICFAASLDLIAMTFKWYFDDRR